MLHMSKVCALAVTATLGLGLAGQTRAADLADFTVTEDFAIPASLTGEPGNPDEGKLVVINRKLGNCLSCHTMPIPEEQFHGETGPSLWGVGARYTPEELRLRVVDPKALNPDSMMPAFYKVKGLHRVKPGFEDQPILTAKQVEDVVAYLATLTEDEPTTN